jgi:hypothetical protein
MKMGAEPKKIVALVGLMSVAGIVYWMNSAPDAPSTPSRPAAAVDPGVVAVNAPAATPRSATRRTATGTAQIGELNLKLPDSVDPTKTDPTLRWDLLTKVQALEAEGGKRNIFLRETPPPEPAKFTANTAAMPNVGKVPVGPQAPPPVAPVATAPTTPPPPAGPPPAAPINLKYYGYSTKRSDGEKKAFFLDGEDIIVAADGEIIKKQYKVVRIGVNSVQMEDTSSKSTQTLPLQQDAAPA